ncbi:hypothetical protein [Marinobacter shengliensis]|uniref:hypothetical protein n=1 Tax=Marinobacter shengliensis TaxID=1389223 RepID=UPI000D10FA00|nr:hypothetical protein [Marinobacter shengliensis]PSF11231.1 hypothetical protein C7H10_15955 [Marinobacter shengliensis]
MNTVETLKPTGGMMKHTNTISIAMPFVMAAAITYGHGAIAEPQINQADLSSSSITIYGTGFGKKDQPAPVLWAFGQDIRENGIQVAKEREISFGSPVPVGKDPSSSIWSSGTGATFSAITRTSDITHTYRANNEGWLGWPHAFGGGNTPYSDKAYISWRIKPAGDINSYRTVRISEVGGVFDSGKDPFSPGEPIQIVTPSGGEISGRIVHFDAANSLVHLEAGGLRLTDSVGAKIIGLNSRASGVLRGDEYFRSSISGKFLRSYETVNQGGTRSIFVTNRWFAVQFDSNGDELRRGFESETDTGYGVPDLSKTTNWKLLEAFIDLSGEYGSGYISMDSKDQKWFKNLYIGESKPKDAGPTISNIGWEPAGGTESVNVGLNFGEIYFDTTPQRVVLSDQGLFSMVKGNQEFQYITEWADQKIVVDLMYGELNQNGPLFIYVFDENNNVNETGFCVANCDADMSPPSKIDLGIN